MAKENALRAEKLEKSHQEMKEHMMEMKETMEAMKNMMKRKNSENTDPLMW